MQACMIQDSMHPHTWHVPWAAREAFACNGGQLYKPLTRLSFFQKLQKPTPLEPWDHAAVLPLLRVGAVASITNSSGARFTAFGS